MVNYEHIFSLQIFINLLTSFLSGLCYFKHSSVFPSKYMYLWLFI